MQAAIVILLGIIILILLGALGPTLYAVAATVVAIAPGLITVAGVFLAALAALVIYRAVVDR